MVKKIFLFGSNYKGTDAELQACLSDCRSIRDFFKTHGYLDEDPLLDSESQIGVIYYSGHSFQLKDGQDEAIYFSEKS